MVSVVLESPAHPRAGWDLVSCRAALRLEKVNRVFGCGSECLVVVEDYGQCLHVKVEQYSQTNVRRPCLVLPSWWKIRGLAVAQAVVRKTLGSPD